MILVSGNASVLKCTVGNHFRVLRIRKIISGPNCKETWELRAQVIFKVVVIRTLYTALFRI